MSIRSSFFSPSPGSVGSSCTSHEAGGPVGTGRRQHRFGVAANGRPGLPDEEAHRTRIKGEPVMGSRTRASPQTTASIPGHPLLQVRRNRGRRKLCRGTAATLRVARIEGPRFDRIGGNQRDARGTGEGCGPIRGALKADARFSDIPIKFSAGDAGTFPKLVVKVRSEIVTLNAGAITPDKDNQLSPAEWKRMMEENPDAVPLDIRNRFESDAGKFENAVVCDIEHFRELPAIRRSFGRLEGQNGADVLHGRHSL